MHYAMSFRGFGRSIAIGLGKWEPASRAEDIAGKKEVQLWAQTNTKWNQGRGDWPVILCLVVVSYDCVLLLSFRDACTYWGRRESVRRSLCLESMVCQRFLLTVFIGQQVKITNPLSLLERKQNVTSKATGAEGGAGIGTERCRASSRWWRAKSLPCGELSIS
jgi:hypothetical protein